jgi:hypothetical protein
MCFFIVKRSIDMEWIIKTEGYDEGCSLHTASYGGVTVSLLENREHYRVYAQVVFNGYSLGVKQYFNLEAAKEDAHCLAVGCIRAEICDVSERMRKEQEQFDMLQDAFIKLSNGGME